MARSKQPINPFYPLLIAVGALFTITAFAYGVMTLREASAPSFAAVEHPLMRVMRERGSNLLVWEVAVLSVLSIAAMATDRFWSRRGGLTAQPPERTTSPEESA